MGAAAPFSMPGSLQYNSGYAVNTGRVWRDLSPGALTCSCGKC